MRRNIIVSVLMALALLVGASTAVQAAQMEVSYTTGSSVSYRLNGNSGSSVTAQFDVTLKNYTAGGGDFDAIGYCVDLAHTISPGTYDVGNLQAFGSFDQNQKEAAWLIHQYAPGLGYNSGYSLKTTIAALQSAVWSIVYDNSSSRYDIYSGNFYLTYSTSYYVRQLAQAMLSNLPTINGGTIGLGDINWSANAKDVYKVDTENRAQELMLASKSVPSTVPEPGTMILFGSALFGAGVMRRRKTKKNKAA
jgi:hypothetical protein